MKAGKKESKGRGPGLLAWACEDLGDRSFVSNGFGGWLLLGRAEADSLRSGRWRGDARLTARLRSAGFLAGPEAAEKASASYRGLCGRAFRGPGLHILVVTLKCNHACVYCRAAGAGGYARSSMSAATARASVDMAFRSPSPDISIEFQGGEALLNWPVVKASVLYAKKKNRTEGRNLALSVVTNLSLMDEARFAFLREQGVGICTSLDGPAFLHDANRRWLGGSSHAVASRWLRRALAAARGGGRDALPAALMTTTRGSLRHPREIVDAYRELGLGGIFLRPLSPIGHAGKVWGEIGYSPAEYGKFYRAALSYIVGLNLKGERFVERGAALLARKLLAGEDPNYLDLRSPCGAAVGQLAYNWDGGVYTCDEGRMAGGGADGFFRLGDVRTDTYASLINAPAARACALASCLEGQPSCSRCAWKPYCGVCPVHNHETQGSPWGDIAAGSWCRTQKEVFAAVAGVAARPAGRRVLEAWLKG